jgi:hypothetical protein
MAHCDNYDICWVDGGEFLDAKSLTLLKARCQSVILFNHDDPTGPRDWRRFRTLRSTIPHYDLCVVVRPFNVAEYQALGARKTIHVYRSYDEVAHAPPQNSDAIPQHYRSDICFIGANYKGEGRDRFLAELIGKGLNVAIWGSKWQSSPVWPVLRPHFRGGDLSGESYAAAIRGSKMCLGFLAQRNRDEHTTRTMEIPYAGGLLCAKRTTEHRKLYLEGVEAIFWDDVEECITECRALLANDTLRNSVREDGGRRVRLNRVGNEDLVQRVITAVGLPSIT